MSTDFKSVLVENRVFEPSEEFKSKARISSMEEYQKLWKESVDQPDVFWAREAPTCSGSSLGKRCSTGRPPTPSGSSEPK